MKIIEEKESIYIKSYQKTPEELKIAEVSAKLASEVLKKQLSVKN